MLCGLGKQFLSYIMWNKEICHHDYTYNVELKAGWIKDKRRINDPYLGKKCLLLK